MLKGTLLAWILVVNLARVLVPPFEFCGDVLHANEFLPPFVRVLPKVPIMCHPAAQGTCELIDTDMDHCPVCYFRVGFQSINFIEVILNWASLPEFVNVQVCTICVVMVSVI